MFKKNFFPTFYIYGINCLLHTIRFLCTPPITLSEMLFVCVSVGLSACLTPIANASSREAVRDKVSISSRGNCIELNSVPVRTCWESQGNVETHWRWSKSLYHIRVHIECFLVNLPVREFWKSVCVLPKLWPKAACLTFLLIHSIGSISTSQ